LRAVYFRDAKGNHCRVAIESYSMFVHIPAPPKKVKRYVLSGELPVIGKFSKHFAEKYEAEAAESDLPSGAENVQINCEEIQVSESGEPVVAASADDMPF